MTKEGHLTQEGFFQLYHMQTLGEPEETFKDLEKFGYNDQLEQETAK